MHFVLFPLSVDEMRMRFRGAFSETTSKMSTMSASQITKLKRCTRRRWMSKRWAAATIDARFLHHSEDGTPSVDASQARVEATHRLMESLPIKNGSITGLVSSILGFTPSGDGTHRVGVFESSLIRHARRESGADVVKLRPADKQRRMCAMHLAFSGAVTWVSDHVAKVQTNSEEVFRKHKASNPDFNTSMADAFSSDELAPIRRHLWKSVDQKESKRHFCPDVRTSFCQCLQHIRCGMGRCPCLHVMSALIDKEMKNDDEGKGAHLADEFMACIMRSENVKSCERRLHSLARGCSDSLEFVSKFKNNVGDESFDFTKDTCSDPWQPPKLKRRNDFTSKGRTKGKAAKPARGSLKALRKKLRKRKKNIKSTEKATSSRAAADACCKRTKKKQKTKNGKGNANDARGRERERHCDAVPSEEDTVRALVSMMQAEQRNMRAAARQSN